MGGVYKHAYATLFAERAPHSNAGMFQTEDDRERLRAVNKEIRYENPISGDEHWILAATGLSHYPSSVAGAFCQVDKQQSHLQDRGWVLQEEILSRRKTCFSETELLW
jgi:hypothetical protein